jgi:hypothetical protein
LKVFIIYSRSYQFKITIVVNYNLYNTIRIAACNSFIMKP